MQTKARRGRSAFLGIFAILALLCALAAPALAQSSPVTVGLILEKHTYTTAEPVWLTIAIDKAAGGPFKVPPDFIWAEWHRSLKVEGTGGPLKFGDLALEEKRLRWIEGPNGRGIPIDLVEVLVNSGDLVNQGPPDVRGSATLAGRVRSITVDLRLMLGPSGQFSPGLYTVSMHRDYPQCAIVSSGGQEFIDVESCTALPIPANTVMFEVVVDPAAPKVTLPVDAKSIVGGAAVPLTGVPVRLFDARDGKQAAAIGFDPRNGRLIWNAVPPLASLLTPGSFTGIDAGQYVAVAEVPAAGGPVYVLSNRTAALVPGDTATLYLRAIQLAGGALIPGTSQLTAGSLLLTSWPAEIRPEIGTPNLALVFEALEGADWQVEYQLTAGVGSVCASGDSRGTLCLAGASCPATLAAVELAIEGTKPQPEAATLAVRTTHGGANKFFTARIPVAPHDTTAPLITCPPDVRVECLGDLPENLGAASGHDDFDPDFSIASSDSGPIVQESTVVRTWTATDRSGNSSSCEQTITVDDTIAPVPAQEVLPAVTGECSAAIATPPTATDNCAGTIEGTTTDPASYSTQGDHTVTWTYDDLHGNTATQTQTVAVHDTTQPVPEIDPLPDVSGQCEVALTTPPTATDNCAGTIEGTTTDPLAYATQGTFDVKWSYSDGVTPAVEQTQRVIVRDTTAPVLNCPAADLAIERAAVPVAKTDPSIDWWLASATATDNCGGTVTVSNDAPDLFPEGTTTVQFTADDGRGNTASCTKNVVIALSQGGGVEAIVPSVQKSLIHFGDRHATFSGMVYLTDGDLAPDFRSGETAKGTLKVAYGGSATPDYENNAIVFSVFDDDPIDNREKWEFMAGPKEMVTFRWKDSQYYEANRDPSIASGGVGALSTAFIHATQTSFHLDFSSATLPVTIVVDGIALVTVRADRTVASALPLTLIDADNAEILFPGRLIPGNRIDWYRDGDLGDGLSAFISGHDATADGSATQTYFNAGGEFWIKVPVTASLAIDSTPRSAEAEITIGDSAAGTKVGAGSLAVPSFTKAGNNWKFN